jgi:hypothetical protein
MKAAFSDSCYIDDANSIRPRGTLAFLRWLSTHYPELKSKINGALDDLEAAEHFDLHSCPPQLQERYPRQKLLEFQMRGTTCRPSRRSARSCGLFFQAG